MAATMAAVGAGLCAWAGQPEGGRQVVGIRLDSDAQQMLGDFAAEIAQRVGEPLDRLRVTESLKRLYGTGRFDELRADVEPKDGGVELIFVARSVFFCGVVRVEGTPKPLDTKVLTDASHLRAGQATSEEELAEASQRLAAVLTANGYYRAGIEYRVTRHPETQEADVLFSIHPGAPARLSRVEFDGQTVMPPGSLAELAGWRPGRHLTSGSIERGLLRIRRFYTAGGRLQATANVQNRTYDPQSNTEVMRVRVEPGPPIRVRVEGARISKAKLKELLPVFRDGVVDDEALSRGGQILADYFQRRGYFSALVTPDRPDPAGEREIEIRYNVTLGPYGEFMGYTFRGNRSIPPAELAAVIAEGQTGTSTAKVFSRELLARHVDALKAAYESRGYLEAQVTPHLDETHSSAHRLSVVFNIDEGQITKVAALTFGGLDQAAEKAVRPLLMAKTGEAYSPERAQTDRDRILAYFADRGYNRASVTWNASPGPAEHQVDLEYHIELGPQERIKRVVIMGNDHTRDSVIRRAVAVREGDPAGQTNLLESQRHLYDLGVFNQVQITKQEAGPEEAETLLVDLEEARRWTVGYGGGIEVQRLGGNQPQGQLKASPRLSLELTRLNVGGRAQTFSSWGRLSNLETGGGLSYLFPRLLGRKDLTLRIDGLVDRSRDVLTFTADRREGSVSVEKRLTPTALILARYSFRRVQALDISTRISPEEIPIVSRPARVGGLGGAYVNDHRDDPADATRGSYSVADASVASSSLGSQASFVRFSGQNSTYWPVGSHLVFARNTRFGVETPFNQTGAASLLAIPLPERFFMGGSESHRGFSINQAGPRDPGTGFPIGGDALFFNSFELRAPLAQKRMGVVVFEDAGNVFSSIRRMRLLKFSQSSPTDFDFAVHAVGLGFRYKTPIAPLRIDLGYALNPPRFQVNTPQGLEVRRLPHFQFFLSIGQSF